MENFKRAAKIMANRLAKKIKKAVLSALAPMLLAVFKFIIVTLLCVTLITSVFSFFSWIFHDVSADNNAEEFYALVGEDITDALDLVEVTGSKKNGYWYKFVDDIDEKLDQYINNAHYKNGEHTVTMNKTLLKKLLKAECTTQLPDLGGNGSSTNNNNGSKVVVIEPGHSVGYDSGATNGSITEAEINQRLAGRIVRKLKEAGYDAYITHTTEAEFESEKLITQAEGDSLDKVCETVNSKNPGLAMAIHHNSGSSSSSGSELYWSSYRAYDTDPDGKITVNGLWGDGKPANLDTTPLEEAVKSKEFAEKIKEKLQDMPKIKFKDIHERDDRLPANAKCPCVLYEGGYISNPTEAEYLNSEEYLEEAGTRIFNAIDEFLGGPGGTSGPITEDTEIMGDSGVQASDLVKAYQDNGSAFPDYYVQRGVDLNKFMEMIVDEAKAEGVNATILFAQIMHETGWLQFGGDVDISQFNFGGIGATGGGVAGNNFAQTYGDNENGIRMGIRVQVQHLKAYASTENLKQEKIDPRFDLVQRGSAKTVSDLAGTWAADTNYAKALVEVASKVASSGSTSSGNTSSGSTTTTAPAATPVASNSAGLSFVWPLDVHTTPDERYGSITSFVGHRAVQVGSTDHGRIRYRNTRRK